MMGLLGIAVTAADKMPGGVPMMQEPVLTWNLFLTVGLVPLCVMILYGAIVRQFKSRDLRDTKIAELQKEAELTKASMIKDRYDSFAATLCTVKQKVEEIADVQHDKVNWSDCKVQQAELRQEIIRLTSGKV